MREWVRVIPDKWAFYELFSQLTHRHSLIVTHTQTLNVDVCLDTVVVEYSSHDEKIESVQVPNHKFVREMLSFFLRVERLQKSDLANNNFHAVIDTAHWLHKEPIRKSFLHSNCAAKSPRTTNETHSWYLFQFTSVLTHSNGRWKRPTFHVASLLTHSGLIRCDHSSISLDSLSWRTNTRMLDRWR